MQNVFQQSFYIGGVWSSNHTLVFKAPFDMQLVRVSAVNTSANAGTIKVGHSSDDDAYLPVASFGSVSEPVEFGRNDFAGGQFPHIPDDTVVVVTLTDHASHMANALVLLTYTQG